MSSDVWSAIMALSTRWRECTSAMAVLEPLKTVGQARNRGIAKFLTNVGVQSMKDAPFQVASKVARLLQQPRFQGVSMPEELPTWIHTATQIEAATRTQLAWVRAQLSGYPLLLVPQLVAGTQYTTPEFSFSAHWSRQDLGRGLQTSAPMVVTVGGEQLDMRSELRALATALQRSEAWQDFDRLRLDLTDGDRESLRAARAYLRSKLSSDSVDRFDRYGALRRHRYRCQMLDAARELLTAGAAAYSDAFDAAASLVDSAYDEVLARLVTYNEPVTVGALEALDLDREGNWCSFSATSFVSPGELLLLSDPLVDEVGQVTAVSMSFEPGFRDVRVRVRLLRGARAAWDL